MPTHPLFHQRPDGHEVAVHHWPAPDSAKGVVLWLHGMAEHGKRYGALGQTLNHHGYHLYCPDHRGHGMSISASSPQGHIADEQGWDTVINDCLSLLSWLAERHPDLPVILGGHSMGSFLALATAQQARQLSGLILCGSDYHPGFYYRLMSLPLYCERWRHGPRGTSPLIHRLTFGAWAKQVDNPKTEFDWLSGDAEQVKAYIDDPLCGFQCTTETWLQLVSGLRRIQSVTGLKRLPRNLPLLLLAGEQDPMSENGRGMMKLEEALHLRGLDVEAHFWPKGRHEILNDHCRPAVLNAIGHWLERRERLPQKQPA